MDLMRPLDRAALLSKNGKTYLAALETRERERTGISSLKVRFNRVFGYYIEISQVESHLVPTTMTGSRRSLGPNAIRLRS